MGTAGNGSCESSLHGRRDCARRARSAGESGATVGLAPTTIGVRSVVMVSARDARRILRTSWIVVLLILTPVTQADVVGGCDDAFRAWLASCAEQEGISLSEDHCADGVAVVAASGGGQVLRIELSLDRRSTLARVGGIGLAPIGDFADWRTAPESFHRSFDAVRACVAARAPVIIPSTQAVEVVACGVRCLSAWGAIGGFVVFMIASAQRRSRWVETGYALSGVAPAAVVRRLAIQPAFFHQNGHGAGWVRMAQCRPSSYGPGYAVLFHPAAIWGGVHGERAVLAAQEVLATAAIGGVYALARNLGNPRPVAWACTVAIGLEPLLGRLARSESYYATSLWLIGMAIAALFATGPRARGRDKRNWGGAALAGLLLATAVTVHPVAWVPAAFAPAVLALRTGRCRERVISSLGAIGLIGAVGATVALPSVRAVLHGQLGAQWGQASPQGARLVWVGTLLAAPWIAVVPPWVQSVARHWPPVPPRKKRRNDTRATGLLAMWLLRSGGFRARYEGAAPYDVAGRLLVPFGDVLFQSRKRLVRCDGTRGGAAPPACRALSGPPESPISTLRRARGRERALPCRSDSPAAISPQRQGRSASPYSVAGVAPPASPPRHSAPPALLSPGPAMPTTTA